MKKLLTLTVMCLVAIAAVAQNVQQAQIKALYKYTELRRHIQGHDFEETDDMILLASPVGSRFFCNIEEIISYCCNNKDL